MTARAQTGLEITSPANPRVKHLVALRHRRARDRAGVTLVEGFEELGLALAAGARPVSLYVCPALMGSGAQQTIDRVSDLGAEVILVSRAVFGKIAYRESPDGWLAVLPAVPTSLASLQTGASPLVLICEGVEKPGNLGAILRTADAAGVTAVIAADPVTDWANPNVVRASKGTVFSVPVASASTAEVFAWLAEHGLALVAAAPDGDVLLTDADLSGPDGDRGRLGSARAPRLLAGARRCAAAHPDVRACRLAQRLHVRGHPRLRGGAAAYGRPAVNARAGPGRARRRRPGRAAADPARAARTAPGTRPGPGGP